ncbi:MAG: ATP-binding protein [Tannerella sp.]|jgi:AAA+ ATPase superfamily predicted ATPase|nr:ATP-binding protein [Tannerella sp.]
MLNKEKSPFLFGKTVSGNEFLNREKDIEHLWLNMRSGINTVLISPRRWGKSSLVEQTATLKSDEKKVKWCFIDMFSIRSEAEFYERFSRELLKATSSKWQGWVANAGKYLKRIVPHINIGSQPMEDFSISFEWEELERHRDEILNLPENIACNQGIQLIVCMDEFQNIHTFKEAEAFEKMLRSHWQHHKHVSYCLYGSKRSIMTDIFNRKNRAFYRFGDLIMLDKIDTEHWQPYITEHFTQTGKAIDDALTSKIITLMQRHPFYIQQLSHYVWELTDTEADEATLLQAIKRMLDVNNALYKQEVEELNNTQVNLLKAILNGEAQMTSVETMRKYSIGTPQNVIKNLRALEKEDIIEKQGKKYALLDPAFALWFKTYYMEKPLTI